MLPMADQFFEISFLDFVLRPSERRLWHGATLVRIGSRAMDLLLVLIDNRDRVVTKDELHRLVWPGRVMQENNLAVQIATLRKILGSHAITTVHGSGYRFTSTVNGDRPDTSDSDDRRASHSTLDGHLPEQRDRIIGREKALADLSVLMKRTRFLTLTGVGGSGKTRLALEYVTLHRDSYPDGVYWFDLAPLEHPLHLTAAVAAAFDTQGSEPHLLVEAIANRLLNGAALVFDSCEHLLESSRALTDMLLQHCSKIHIVATSREPLRVLGEQLYVVPPLSLPTEPGLPAAIASESVRMFQECAQRALHDFAASEANISAIVRICERLDGIPLAIEIAAAQVRLLPVAEIEARLEERFKLLVNSVHSNPRHQTMAKALEWSVDTLTVKERIVFDQMSVFVDNWTVDAARAVTDSSDYYEVLDVMRRLLDKSLITVAAPQTKEAVQPRFRMLETVRQFALSRLKESKVLAQTRTRHLRFFLELAESGRHSEAWMSRMSAEHHNLVAAYQWSVSVEDVMLSLRLIWAVWFYFIDTGQSVTAYPLARAVLSGRAGADPLTQCRALTVTALHAFELGLYDETLGLADDSVAMSTDLGDQQIHCIALHARGIALRELGRVPEAIVVFEEARDRAKAANVTRSLGQALEDLAETYRIQERFEDAAKAYEEVLQLARISAIPSTVASILCSLALSLIGARKYERVPNLLLESLGLVSVARINRLVSEVLAACCSLAAGLEDHSVSAEFAAAAAGVRRIERASTITNVATRRAQRWLSGLEAGLVLSIDRQTTPD